MSTELLDVALLAFLGVMTLTGWHRGLLMSASSLAGMVVGLLVAREVLSKLPNPLNPPSLPHIAAYLIVGFFTVSVMSAIGGWLGRRLRRVLRWRPARSVDSAAGALFSLSVWAVVVWVAASVLVATPVRTIPALVSDSRVVAELDTYMPSTVRDGIARVRSAVAEADLPSTITSALSGPNVDLPAAALVKAAAVQSALGSVVRVEGTSTSCTMRMTGTGFAVGKGLVLTNAHVVAGTDHVAVRVKGVGRLHTARVIYFDPATDVAVLRVPGLPAAALPIGQVARRGTGAVIAGFPGGGKLSVVLAGVRRVDSAAGTDIYGKGRVKRQVYVLLADIKKGDSGAPLIAADGTVIGMVFASSATDPATGYALGVAELQGVATLDPKSSTVSTGDCAP